MLWNDKAHTSYTNQEKKQVVGGQHVRSANLRHRMPGYWIVRALRGTTRAAETVDWTRRRAINTANIEGRRPVNVINVDKRVVVKFGVCRVEPRIPVTL